MEENTVLGLRNLYSTELVFKRMLSVLRWGWGGEEGPGVEFKNRNCPLFVEDLNAKKKKKGRS